MGKVGAGVIVVVVGDWEERGGIIEDAQGVGLQEVWRGTDRQKDLEVERTGDHNAFGLKAL